MSHPAWVCGLKRAERREHRRDHAVTPCVGVWIETSMHCMSLPPYLSHTLRGCVD